MDIYIFGNIYVVYEKSLVVFFIEFQFHYLFYVNRRHVFKKNWILIIKKIIGKSQLRYYVCFLCMHWVLETQ